MSKIRAELRRLHSPDIFDLRSFVLTESDSFGFLLQIMAGPVDQEGEESFDVFVCNPRWFMERVAAREVKSGRHHLIMGEYNYDRLESFIKEYCRRCEGENWSEVAKKLGRLGKWEFEDYNE